MCLENPHLPWGVSFQLSFGTMLGLILCTGPLLAWFTTLLERWQPSDRTTQLVQRLLPLAPYASPV